MKRQNEHSGEGKEAKKSNKKRGESDKEGGEINRGVGANNGKCMCYAPFSLSLTLPH